MLRKKLCLFLENTHKINDSVFQMKILERTEIKELMLQDLKLKQWNFTRNIDTKCTIYLGKEGRKEDCRKVIWFFRLCKNWNSSE